MNYNEMKVSLRRIQKFLLCHEVQPNIVERKEFKSKSTGLAIAIKVISARVSQKRAKSPKTRQLTQLKVKRIRIKIQKSVLRERKRKKCKFLVIF